MNRLLTACITNWGRCRWWLIRKCMKPSGCGPVSIGISLSLSIRILNQIFIKHPKSDSRTCCNLSAVRHSNALRLLLNLESLKREKITREVWRANIIKRQFNAAKQTKIKTKLFRFLNANSSEAVQSPRNFIKTELSTFYLRAAYKEASEDLIYSSNTRNRSLDLFIQKAVKVPEILPKTCWKRLRNRLNEHAQSIFGLSHACRQ